MLKKGRIFMNKAEKYLSERIDFMSDERAVLLIKIDEIDLEIKEIEYKITDLKNSIDDVFEIFSPRTKKNDFIKNEIESLENKVESLTALKYEYCKKDQKILEDIDIIKDILEYDTEDNDINNDDMNMGRLIKEKERISIAGRIDEMTLRPISSLIHKCEMCGKLLEIDTVRAKLEIEVMYKTLNELYDDIKLFTGELRKSIQDKESSDPIKNISVKKLSKDNLSRGN